MSITAFGLTDIGRSRTNNEDAFLVDHDLALYVVADGMGGHAGGEIASQMTVELIRQHVAEHRAATLDVPAERRGNALKALIGAAIQYANAKVHETGNAVPTLAGMGATATALLCDGNQVVIGHVGDSRAYLIRDGAAHRVTTDHTLTEELIAKGFLLVAQAATHPHRHMLTRNIGARPTVEVDTLLIVPAPVDRILLCSDGLTEYASDPDWLATKISAQDSEAAVEALIRHANDSGGRDNITALLVTMDPNQRRAWGAGLWGLMGRRLNRMFSGAH